MINIAKVKPLNFLKTWPFLHSNIASVCRFFFALHNTNRTKIQKEGGQR